MVCRYLGEGRVVALLYPIWKRQAGFLLEIGERADPECSALLSTQCNSSITLCTRALQIHTRQYQPQHPVPKASQPHCLLLTSASKGGGPPGGQEAAAPAGKSIIAGESIIAAWCRASPLMRCPPPRSAARPAEDPAQRACGRNVLL